MSKWVTLGADELGQVYGLKVNDDGSLIYNSLGYSTSCDVIRPVSRNTYEYMTEDPDSAKELWKVCVEADKTELGLEEWFEQYVHNDDIFDKSFVFELLESENNNTIIEHDRIVNEKIDALGDDDDGPCEEDAGSEAIWDKDGQPMSFARKVKLSLIESDDIKDVSDEDDVYDWESSGLFPPDKPFVVEFAPKELLEQYYAHLRETYKEFKG